LVTSPFLLRAKKAGPTAFAKTRQFADFAGGKSPEAHAGEARAQESTYQLTRTRSTQRAGQGGADIVRRRAFCVRWSACTVFEFIR
jgi:hypothetical protein